jgi:transposase
MPKRRRRSFTPQFKAQVVLEVLSGQRSASESARQHKLKPELISRRKDIALEGLEALFEGDDQRSRDQERIAELERMVGRLTMELEVAKKSRLGPAAAAQLGMSPVAVRIAKSRVLARLRAEAEELID